MLNCVSWEKNKKHAGMKLVGFAIHYTEVRDSALLMPKTRLVWNNQTNIWSIYNIVNIFEHPVTFVWWVQSSFALILILLFMAVILLAGLLCYYAFLLSDSQTTCDIVTFPCGSLYLVYCIVYKVASNRVEKSHCNVISEHHAGSKQ